MAGPIQKKEYIQTIETTAFINVAVQKEKPILLPEDVLKNYFSEEEIASFKKNGTGIYSITVYAEKPVEKNICCKLICCTEFMEIMKMLPQHWEDVKRIYEEGIATGNATFQISAPGWEEWNSSHLQACRLVSVENDKLLGWVALTPVSGRCVYAGVAEVSVYVAYNARGKGVGKQLLQSVINESEHHNIWTLQAGIFPENIGSIKIHEVCGFRVIGRRERIGKMNGVWRDTILLERRSTVVGID